MSSTAPTELRDEALRKIGRNVVSLQRMERALKLLIVGSNIQGYASELAANYTKKTTTVEKRSLGLLVQEFIESIHVREPRAAERTGELNEAWLSISFTIKSDKRRIEKRRMALARVVEERNDLIHNLLSRFDPESTQSCQYLIKILDEQNERLEPHQHFVSRTLSQLHSLQKEVLKHMEAILSQSSRGNTDAV